MTLGVVASKCLPHLPFDDIGPLGLHDVECTLELQLHPHWMTMELLVDYRPGIEILSHLWFGVWMVAFPAQGDHAILYPVLTLWLTCLLEFFLNFEKYFADDSVLDESLKFCYFLEGGFVANIFQFGIH